METNYLKKNNQKIKIRKIKFIFEALLSFPLIMWQVPFYHYRYNSEPNRPGPCFPGASSQEEGFSQDHLKIKTTIKEKKTECDLRRSF